jgi:hypothetical protein
MARGAISLMCLSVAAPAAAQDALRNAVFAPRTAAAAIDPGARFVEHDSYVPGAGPRIYQSGELQLKQAKGAVDSVRINIAGALRGPGGLPLNLAHGQFDARSVDVTLIRTWPQALSLATDSGLAFQVSPHAGLGFSSRGGQAEAGAVLKVSKSRGAAALERLRDMGVADGTTFGDTGRWYLFAAASGRAVGLNMLPSDFGWSRAGWSTDETTDLVGDAQIGVGWKKGDVQSSFGVIHREVKGRHMVFHQDTRDDTVAAFTLTIKPTQK